MTRRILVVDDDPHICDVIAFALDKAGMHTAIARDGAEAWTKFCDTRPDLVVLDIGLPEIDGLELCRRMRKIADTPILFLSARDDEIDRVLGLEIGGDDYVTKPFSPRELAARVSVILRRTINDGDNKDGVDAAVLSHGEVTLDRSRRAVSFAGKPAPLTALEFEMVACLMRRPGIVLTREQLMQNAYADNIHVSDRTIDSHVRNIRNKFAACGCANVIETVKGVGFRIGPCVTA